MPLGSIPAPTAIQQITVANTERSNVETLLEGAAADIDSATIRGIADHFKVHWRDIAEINLFKGRNGKYQMPFSTTRLKKGTGINLPCLRLNITKVMSIIQNLTEAARSPW